MIKSIVTILALAVLRTASPLLTGEIICPDIPVYMTYCEKDDGKENCVTTNQGQIVNHPQYQFDVSGKVIEYLPRNTCNPDNDCISLEKIIYLRNGDSDSYNLASARLIIKRRIGDKYLREVKLSEEAYYQVDIRTGERVKLCVKPDKDQDYKDLDYVCTLDIQDKTIEILVSDPRTSLFQQYQARFGLILNLKPN